MKTPLDDLPWVKYRFFGREWNARTEQGKAGIAAEMGVADTRLLTLRQTHSADVVTAPWGDAVAVAPEGDALVTATAGLALGVLTADCVPVLFAAPAARMVAAAHAGWQGAFAGVCKQTVAALADAGAAAHDIVAVIGPCIRQETYEVDTDFVQKFLAQDEANAAFFCDGKRAGHAWFDIAGYVARQLRDCGVLSVYDTGLNTYSQAESAYYSHRRACHDPAAPDGRQMSCIMIADA